MLLTSSGRDRMGQRELPFVGGVHGKQVSCVESTVLGCACRAMPVAMTDGAETEGSDGGGPVERDQKKHININIREQC